MKNELSFQFVFNFQITFREFKNIFSHMYRVAVDAVVYYRVWDPVSAVTNVANAAHSTRLLAQTTLRNQLGQLTLSGLLSERDSISQTMQGLLDTDNV